ncbi:pilin [Patescibacteria group bacterium]
MRKKFLLIIIICLILAGFLYFFNIAEATSLESPGLLAGKSGDEASAWVIGRFINGAIAVVGAVTFFMFVYGGFTWIASAGSSDSIQKGKNIMIWATIGLIIVLFSYATTDLIITALTGPPPPPPPPPPPSYVDNCQTGASCRETADCGALSTPMQPASGTCEGTALAQSKPVENFKCCTPFPADTCPGECIADSIDCITLTPPKKEGDPDSCQTSALAGKPKCCSEPTGICAWSPQQGVTGTVPLPGYPNCAQTASICCDCAKHPDTQTRLCQKMEIFYNPSRSGIWYYGYNIVKQNFTTTAETKHCGTENDVICSEACVKTFVDAMLAPWTDCLNNIRAPGTSLSDADYCINYAWNYVWKNSPPGDPCTIPPNCPEPAGPPWPSFTSCRIIK